MGSSGVVLRIVRSGDDNANVPTSGARISGKTDHIAPDRIFADRLWRAHFTTFDPGED